jgi:integrase/recombinase XerC
LELIHGHVAHMRRRGLADGTIVKRRARLRTFDRSVGLCSAQAEDVEAFLDGRRGREGPLSTKARYDWVSDLGCFYSWALDWGHLDHDPTVRVARPKQRQGLPRPIDSADLAMALRLAEPMMRAWLALMSFGGLRCAEVSRLDVDCLLWNDGLLRVLGKGQKERMVPMHREVERTLRSLNLPARGAVFRRPRGGRYPPAQVSKETSLYFDSLGIGATAHQCRHLFGTLAYRACRDLRVVQELMGHASPTTTAVYAAWSKAEARRVVEALELDDTDRSLFSDWSA